MKTKPSFKLKQILLFLVVLVAPFSSHAVPACGSPLFNFCSILIGSDDEWRLFKGPDGANAHQVGGDWVSADGCIKFVDLVTNNANWQQNMLTLSQPCHAILVSGHHDAWGSAQNNPLDLVRNRYVYSDTAYPWEASLGRTGTSGNRLDLSSLARTDPVCGDIGKFCDANGRMIRNGQLIPDGEANHSCQVGRPANSGQNLLGEVLVSFLFACNLLRDDDPKGTTLYHLPDITTSRPDPRRPGFYIKTELKDRQPAISTNPIDIPSTDPFTFYKRSLAIFNRSIHTFGFQYTAPTGVAISPALKTFFIKMKAEYNRNVAAADMNYGFLTRYLRDLSVIRQYENGGGDLSDAKPEFSKLIVGNPKALDILGQPITMTSLAVCMSRKPNCSNVEVGFGSVCDFFNLDTEPTLADSNPRKCTAQHIQDQSRITGKAVPSMVVCSNGKTERKKYKDDYCGKLDYTLKHVSVVMHNQSRPITELNSHLEKIKNAFSPEGTVSFPANQTLQQIKSKTSAEDRVKNLF